MKLQRFILTSILSSLLYIAGYSQPYNRSTFVHKAVFDTPESIWSYFVCVHVDCNGRKGYLVWEGNPFVGYSSLPKMTKTQLQQTILRDKSVILDSTSLKILSDEYIIYEDELMIKDESLEDVLSKYCKDDEVTLKNSKLMLSVIVFLFNHNVFTYGNCDGAIICTGYKTRKQERDELEKLKKEWEE